MKMFNPPRIATQLALVLFLLSLALVFGSRTRAAENSPSRALPLEFDRSIPLSLQSAPVQWHGSAYHLLQLGSIRFTLDRETGRLTAEVKGGVTSFDNVDYIVGAAVFGGDGQLLGTARAEQKIQRDWLGKVLQSSATVTLDFGSSLDYANAKTFQLSISNRKVLTPDDWQKSQ